MNQCLSKLFNDEGLYRTATLGVYNMINANISKGLYLVCLNFEIIFPFCGASWVCLIDHPKTTDY